MRILSALLILSLLAVSCKKSIQEEPSLSSQMAALAQKFPNLKVVENPAPGTNVPVNKVGSLKELEAHLAELSAIEIRFDSAATAKFGKAKAVASIPIAKVNESGVHTYVISPYYGIYPNAGPTSAIYYTINYGAIFNYTNDPVYGNLYKYITNVHDITSAANPMTFTSGNWAYFVTYLQSGSTSSFTSSGASIVWNGNYNCLTTTSIDGNTVTYQSVGLISYNGSVNASSLPDLVVIP